jgi:hypothetical protein
MVLRNQVESFERVADELRLSASRGGWGGHRGEVEALMATLVAQFKIAGEVVWRAQDSGAGMSAADEARMHGLYVRLSKTFDDVLTYGRSVERSGHPVAGKAEFLSAWRELKGIAAVEPARLAESIEQLRRGTGTTLGELADELSRKFGR